MRHIVVAELPAGPIPKSLLASNSLVYMVSEADCVVLCCAVLRLRLVGLQTECMPEASNGLLQGGTSDSSNPS